MFTRAIKSIGYRGKYHYCYCTKSSHFSYVLNEVLRYDAQIETSSGFDIDIILKLHEKGKVKKDKIIICNGFKTEGYLSKIATLINEGFENVIPVCDNVSEIEYYEKHVHGTCKLGIRVATEEEPNF